MPKVVYQPGTGVIQTAGSGFEVLSTPFKESQESLTLEMMSTHTLAAYGVSNLTVNGVPTLVTQPNGTVVGQLKFIVNAVDDGGAEVTVTISKHTSGDNTPFASSAPGDSLLLVWGGEEWSTIAASGFA